MFGNAAHARATRLPGPWYYRGLVGCEMSILEPDRHTRGLGAANLSEPQKKTLKIVKNKEAAWHVCYTTTLIHK